MTAVGSLVEPPRVHVVEDVDAALSRVPLDLYAQALRASHLGAHGTVEHLREEVVVTAIEIDRLGVACLGVKVTGLVSPDLREHRARAKADLRESGSGQVGEAGGNVFASLGFDPEQSSGPVAVGHRRRDPGQPVAGEGEYEHAAVGREVEPARVPHRLGSTQRVHPGGGLERHGGWAVHGERLPDCSRDRRQDAIARRSDCDRSGEGVGVQALLGAHGRPALHGSIECGQHERRHRECRRESSNELAGIHDDWQFTHPSRPARLA